MGVQYILPEYQLDGKLFFMKMAGQCSLREERMISSAFRYDQETGYMRMKLGKTVHPLSAYRLLVDEFDSFDDFKSKFGIRGDLPKLQITERDYIDAYCILFSGEDEYKAAFEEIWNSVFFNDSRAFGGRQLFQAQFTGMLLENCFEKFFGKNPDQEQIIEWIESAGEEGNYAVYESVQDFLKKQKSSQ